MSESSRRSRLTFQQREWERVHERRKAAFPEMREEVDDEGRPSEPDETVGVSLSGGGLRSAMFNDGFLQGLSHAGFLRYVDYICSVSGGGYIAGHLATRAERSSKTGFHDDTTDGNPRWALGRAPSGGMVDSSRLVGAGRYLASKLALAPSFLWSMLLSSLLYLGLIGVLATLIALFWRSFDDPMFRVLLRDVLDFKFGGELAIAFYPTLLVLIVWGGACIAAWLANSQRRLAISRAGLIFFLASVGISVAVFLGNGKTDASRNGSAALQLNHYAQALAIAAAVLQLFAFIGRDKLFRSERDEAKYWQKSAQKFATTGVVLFACFAMVHWMARENISAYTTHRSLSLVRGDVTDWDLLQRLSLKYKSQNGGDAVDTAISDWPQPQQELDVGDDIAESGINLPDEWDQHQLVHPLIPLTEGAMTYRPSDPPRHRDTATMPAWHFWERIGGFFQAYLYTRTTPEEDAFVPMENKRQRFSQTPETMHDFYMLAHFRWRQQRAFLQDFNRAMEQVAFSRFLLRVAESSQVEIPDEVLTPILRKIQLTRIEPAAISPVDQASEGNGADDPAESTAAVGGGELAASPLAPSQAEPSQQGSHLGERERNELTAGNRALLGFLFPKAIQDPNVASTLVVPPYDQAARIRWLLFWWSILCVGVCLSALRNQTATIYVYYRNRLSRLFLSSLGDPLVGGTGAGAASLSGLRPTTDGLPHPLFLAARLTPAIVKDSYRVLTRPFLFSPIYCGDPDGRRFETTQLSLSCTGNRPLCVGDAVTLSGAAVTPLMTENRSLSLILSFFGDGLGQWLIRHPSRRSIKSERRGFRAAPITVFLLGSLLVFSAFLCWYQFGIYFTLALIAVISVGALILIERDLSGTFRLACEMFFPGKIGPKEIDNLYTAGPAKENDASAGRVGYVADGGFYDYLGVSELFRRKCSLIVVSDAGANLGNNPLGPLAKMCSSASEQFGIQILDLDHDAPIDFGRLEIDRSIPNERVVHQPYLVARLRYADQSEGLLVYCQMAITDTDPIEIQQIRHRFPSFPDEPTTNQFYTDEQVSAYRNLGHHIATRICSELQRWTSDDLTHRGGSTSRLPLLDVIRKRILTAYRLACYQEQSYKPNDVFSEAIWSSGQANAPAFHRLVRSELNRPELNAGSGLALNWLQVYERSGDVRAKYRSAILSDINTIDDVAVSNCARLWQEICGVLKNEKGVLPLEEKALMAAHLSTIAVACHEIHQGRPNAIFQVGGRGKLIALTENLAGTIYDLIDVDDQLGPHNRLHVPANQSELSTACKKCVGEVIELEKSTFQGAERITTVSFAQCMVMMWGVLAKHEDAPPKRPTTKYRDAIERVSREGLEMGTSRVRIKLERGLRTMSLGQVVLALQNAWIITYLPPSVFRTKSSNPSKTQTRSVTPHNAPPKETGT